jgi:hypothetical protein
VAEVAAIIALSGRLKQLSRKSRDREVVADLTLAASYLRVLAVLKIADEAPASAVGRTSAMSSGKALCRM